MCSATWDLKKTVEVRVVMQGGGGIHITECHRHKVKEWRPEVQNFHI